MERSAYYNTATGRYVDVSDAVPLPVALYGPNGAPARVSKTAENAAVAAGTSMAVWTPASGKKWVLEGLLVCADTPGNYTLYDGITVLIRLMLPARQPVLAFLDQRIGLVSAAANQSLNLYNETGGAVGLRAFAWGAEV